MKNGKVAPKKARMPEFSRNKKRTGRKRECTVHFLSKDRNARSPLNNTIVPEFSVSLP